MRKGARRSFRRRRLTTTRGRGRAIPRRWPWARLLHRVFAIQVLLCDRCRGPRRILGAVTEPDAVRRALVALGLAAEPPPGRPVPAADPA